MIENKLTKNIFAFLLIILFGISVPGVKGQTIDPRSVTELLENLKEDSGVKSLLAGIWEGEREILTIAMGESMTDYPATVDMHIRIGGISETFLGTLLMILNERNLISLDDRVSKWLPDFLAADEVTLDMLITNTAGYKDYVNNEEFIDLVMSHPFRNTSREEIFQYSTSGGTMNFPPGTSQKYSHTEFTILGVILELATGKTMAELYEEYIFQPLDLRRTGYSENAFLPLPVLHSFSTDRDIYEDATYWSPSWTGESGPLYSTLHDLGRWTYHFGKGTLLNSDSFDKLTRRMEGAPPEGSYFASGFGVTNGWFIQNPNFNGYSGAFGYLPSGELSVIVFTTQSENTKPGQKAYEIFKEIVSMIAPEAPLGM